MKKTLEHYFNPLHIYCRLKDLHFHNADYLTIKYERMYKVLKTKWYKRLPQNRKVYKD